MKNIRLIDKVNSLPRVPGVYLYKNLDGKIIYVGKAKNLQNRVKSYFGNIIEEGTKTSQLVKSIRDIEYIEVLSELEALILEAELIKRHKPKYNILLKDDKSYIYIVIRKERVKLQKVFKAIPKILTARKNDIKNNDIVFGPYPESSSAQFVLKTIRKAFPFRDCSVNKFNRHSKLNSPCLWGHLNLCQAPCTTKITTSEYIKGIKKIEKLLLGESASILNSLKRNMTKASRNMEYEKAITYRETLRKFEYVRQTFKSPNKYLENPYLVEDLITKSLKELVENIPVLKILPNRIECYDISNISGKQAVGSMVVAINGRLWHKEYRRFKIKLSSAPDDFDMLKEVIRRRLKREYISNSKLKKWEKPDLFIIDGGKGQVSAIRSVLKEFKLDIPIVGIAKKYETLIYIENNVFNEVLLDKNNEGLKLIQRLRDEAHRFAQKYHHYLRLKTLDE